jgi:hypothetical protein
MPQTLERAGKVTKERKKPDVGEPRHCTDVHVAAGHHPVGATITTKDTAMHATLDLQAANGIINDLNAYIHSWSGRPWEWYVGIANSTERLFQGHNVDKNGVWIFRTAPTAILAREIETSFHKWGCKGGPGGGGYDTRIVYAYRITATTSE